MTEFDLEGQGEDLFVPWSEMGGDEPDTPDASRAARARIHNDYPVSIAILRRSDGKYRYLFGLDSGATTSEEFWDTDEVWITTLSGFKWLTEFTSGGGWTFKNTRKVSLAAGTNNVSRLLGLVSSATDGGEAKTRR
ncbi:hypothetical protein [Nocardia exalbida]|uniref:hypothetical protein n=1 Tax=Nocardia exalbida TaxID=290231 RepID=UPI0005941A56|nr:hypothetical protein [Nocardia exalbida]